jgi:mannose-1-phosphate guanylyltransferase
VGFKVFLFVYMVDCIVPVILCGGYGRRLWPLSTPSFPKQFLKLYGCFSMFQHTVLRVSNKKNLSPPFIVGNKTHLNILDNQLKNIGVRNESYLLETTPKNTSISIILTAIHLAKKNDPIVLILPTDHYIENEVFFINEICDTLQKAHKPLLNGAIVSFGIPPRFFEKKYGYIKRDISEYKLDGIGVMDGLFKALCFIEKPPHPNFIKTKTSNPYYWNSGVYAAKSSVILSLAKKLAPKTYNLCLLSMKKAQNPIKKTTIPNPFFLQKTKNCSFDKKIIEKHNYLLVKTLNTPWFDLGSWKGVREVLSLKKTQQPSVCF